MPNLTEEMSAFIELQMQGSLFTDILKLLCSASPNPIPTFPFLEGRLIHSVTFGGSGEMIVTPHPGLTPTGQVTVSFPVTLTSIKRADFI